MAILLQNAYLTLSTDPDAPIIRAIRSERRFSSSAQDEFVQAHLEALRIVETLDRRKLGLLIDLRRAGMNNDPQFEGATKRVRDMITDEFAHVAFLVQTAVGVLQVNRLVRESEVGMDMNVFNDEAAAVSFLAAAVAGKPESRFGPSSTQAPTSRSAGRTAKQR
jgi:hypothetical protein